MKMKNIMLKEMRLTIIGLFLLGSVPLMMAGENPSAKPVHQKSWFESLFGGSSVQAIRSTVQFTPTKSVSMPSSASSSAPSLSVPTISGSSNLFRHTAVPSAVAAPRTATSQTSSGATSAFGSLSTDRLKKTSNVSGSGFSGGASAGGLMSSGSQYSSSAANGGSGSVSGSGYTPSITGGPRRGFVDDDDPLPDPEQPLGDAAWPLALLACAYLILRVARKRARALKR